MVGHPLPAACTRFLQRGALDGARIGADQRSFDDHARDERPGDEDLRDIGAIAAFFAMSNRLANPISMRPNDEFGLMGRVPRERKA